MDTTRPRTSCTRPGEATDAPWTRAAARTVDASVGDCTCTIGDRAAGCGADKRYLYSTSGNHPLHPLIPRAPLRLE
eukprot:scaffold150225_cov33-Tisochrysis_lutea.AAC.1